MSSELETLATSLARETARADSVTAELRTRGRRIADLEQQNAELRRVVDIMTRGLIDARYRASELGKGIVSLDAAVTRTLHQTTTVDDD